jgi:hypothetical protein
MLQDTEGVYQRSLDRLVEAKLGLSLKELHVADLPYLMRAPEYDAVFAAERLVPTFSDLLADMGIDLAAQANVHLDAEPRELKAPRAFCAPVRVPGEIYLVVMPKGGQDDYQALLHEGGHTQHFAHTRPELAFEYRHLGDMAVTEGYAFIMDHLVLNPRWLERYLDFVDSSEFITFATIVDLYFLRRYCGKLAYETELHKETGSLTACLTTRAPSGAAVGRRQKATGRRTPASTPRLPARGCSGRSAMLQTATARFRDEVLAAGPGRRGRVRRRAADAMCGGKADFHPQHLIERDLGAEEASGPGRRSPSRSACARRGAADAPSNSAKKMPCQVPRARLPSSTGITTLEPTRLAFTCASALPSRWLKGRSAGEADRGGLRSSPTGRRLRRSPGGRAWYVYGAAAQTPLPRPRATCRR